jgi:3-deoxy-D-manno-octulosonic acid kinase
VSAAAARERIHASGRVTAIYDAERHAAYDPLWFDRAHWQANGAALATSTGRGSVLVLERGAESWVYRHYHRGGFVANLVFDHYLWLGLDRTRSFKEWRLLDYLHRRGLPTPEPVAARVVRQGIIYQADILTVLLPGTTPLSAYLRVGGVESRVWTEIGATIRRLHDHGVDHPDLTAHNILVDSDGRAFIVDFDNATIRPEGRWRAAGMARLQRSLRKVALETGTVFDEAGWNLIRKGYE